MYARGMSQRDIAATIEDIYGFQMSHEQISTITGCVMEELRFFCSGLFCHIHCFGAVPDVLERIRLQAFDKIQSQGSSFTFPPPSS